MDPRLCELQVANKKKKRFYGPVVKTLYTPHKGKLCVCVHFSFHFTAKKPTSCEQAII